MMLKAYLEFHDEKGSLQVFAEIPGRGYELQGEFTYGTKKETVERMLLDVSVEVDFINLKDIVNSEKFNQKFDN